MARYHKNLTYHEDNEPKHEITGEEIEFLMKIQKEMNTQNTVCQADPRFWIICGSEKEYGIETGYEDGSELIDENGGAPVANSIEEAFTFIQEEILEQVNDIDGVKRELLLIDDFLGKRIKVSDSDSKYNYELLETMDDVVEWLHENGFDEYRCANYRIIEKKYDNTMFLTQKAAEKHLRANDYHYSEDAHTYAMTAWRSEEVASLYEILRKVDWSKLKNKQN